MSLYIVSYDLHNQRTYPPVWDYLQKLGAKKLLESVWVVSTSLTAISVRDDLQRVMDSDDSCAVIELKSGSWWAGVRLKPEGKDWLIRYLMA